MEDPFDHYREAASQPTSQQVWEVAHAAGGILGRALKWIDSRGKRQPAPRRPELVKHIGAEVMPLMLALELVRTSRQHLQGIATLLTSDDSSLLPVAPVMTLCRSTIECAARGWWVLSPDSVRGQVARALVIHLEHLRSSDRMFQAAAPAMGDDDFQRRDGDPWPIKGAQDYGLNIDRSKKQTSNHVIGFDGERIPKDSDMVPDFLAAAVYEGEEEGLPLGKALYASLGAATHGLAWVTTPTFAVSVTGPVLMCWALEQSLLSYGALVDLIFGRDVVRHQPAFQDEYQERLRRCSEAMRAEVPDIRNSTDA